MRDSLVKLVVGKLGAGKSAYCVGKMIDALAAGDVVVSNIKLDWPAVEAYLKAQRVTVPRDNYRYVDSEAIDRNPATLLDHLADGGACLVIDEIHLWLGARAWRENEAKAKSFFEFLTQARKLSVDCYLITQDERNADAVLARMATHIVRVMNWRHLPVLGAVLPFPLTVAKICQPDGRTQVGKEWIWRQKGLLNLYNSKQRFREIELKGKRAGKVKGQRKKEMTWGAKIAALGLVLLVIDGAMRWQAAKRERERILAEAAEAAAKAEKAARREAQRPRRAPVASLPAQNEPGISSEPRKPLAWSWRERASVEAQLPGIYRVGRRITLMGGHRLGLGSFFLTGRVTGWKRQDDSVLLAIDSPETPEVRLFYGYSSGPCLYDYNGGVLRRATRGGGGGNPRMVPLSPPGDRPGDGIAPAVGPANGGWLAHSEYKAPEAVIPETSGGTYIPLGPRVKELEK